MGMSSVERTRRWRERHPERVREVKLRYLKKLPNGTTYSPTKRAAYRKAAIEALGGKCAECDLDIVEILLIDHVNTDGAEHRRQKGTGSVYYRDIIENALSGRFQLLCPNCSAIKDWSSGVFRGRPRRKESLVKTSRFVLPQVKITAPGEKEEE